ncbi:MAG: NAD(P)/FAD-dependent oxidoreductase [Chitinophagaceae bacterium]|nr:NAD(P)/FAD-dependent oxidoreductase [Chitinophagaceae bacterium]MBK7678625.1 NAD(P)/FAD-dependent oxidoreductase [Chitinophagaceae bacterium]MBK8300029.1 NAD(P)/FAD-dependent oxidoreductase [Chitinophagaceae bacterium]MBK9464073.1 NAD(P)/FAD-dependent oxidoreductase [Chitinophagaceae bacterium]MBK9658808.1 NAD(P)/FAD-dependent oxidoreductase [Chitinophagaceae bacterium]
MQHQHQIVIIGGGNAGISVAAQLLRKNKQLDISIIDPASKHYYQPAWTLVGSGVFDIQKTERNEADVLPEGVKWVKQKVTSMTPENNTLQLDNGDNVQYEYLIVAPGIQLNWHEIKGLKETLGKNNVCSNYSFEQAPYTFECIKNFKGGKAIFHNPQTPVKCGGAPHKIMYMAADYFRKHNLLDKANIQYWSGAAKLFAVPKYEKTLLKVCERAGIKLNFMVKMTEIDGPGKKAKFIGIGEDNKDKEYEVEFDMIHVTPPQSAPDFIKSSSLANAAGWVDVDKHTLQHVKFANIFSLGDSSGLPISKTGAAIRKQAPVVVENMLATINHLPLTGIYNGYTSCPLVTGYGKLVLAEFDYDNIPQETFPFDQSKERWSMYQMKRRVLPWLYWNKILPGKM